MPLNEQLADRLRFHFANRKDIVEKKMFGGLAFMFQGHMCVGVSGDNLMARVGPEQYQEALKAPDAREMDFTGRPLKGFVFVSKDGIHDERRLTEWVELCDAFIRTLPAK